MLVKPCLECGHSFFPTMKRHIFCSIICKRRWYYKNVETSSLFPKFICPSCNTTTQLDFDIRKDLDKWKEFACPNCGKSPIEAN